MVGTIWDNMRGVYTDFFFYFFFFFCVSIGHVCVRLTVQYRVLRVADRYTVPTGGHVYVCIERTCACTRRPWGVLVLGAVSRKLVCKHRAPLARTSSPCSAALTGSAAAPPRIKTPLRAVIPPVNRASRHRRPETATSCHFRVMPKLRAAARRYVHKVSIGTTKNLPLYTF